jgi:hypothetical protein
MSTGQQPQPKPTLRKTAALTFTVAYSFALVYRLCISMFIRRAFGTRAFGICISELAVQEVGVCWRWDYGR